MYNRVNDFLSNLKILYEFQFGFRKKRSTYLAHLILLDRITKSLDNGETALGIYLDFSKAFDTVNHDILLKKIYHYGIRGNAYMMYCNPVWGNASAVHFNKLHVLQKKIVRIIAGVKPRTSTDDLFRNLNIMKLDEINIFLIAQVMHKQYTADVIPVFQNMFIKSSDIHSYETRQSNHLNIPLCHKDIGKTSIRYRGAIIWNNVLKSGIPLDQSNMFFKQQLRKQIMSGSIRDKLH